MNESTFVRNFRCRWILSHWLAWLALPLCAAPVREVWVKNLRPANLPPSEDRALALALDAAGHIYLTGTSGKDFIAFKLDSNGSEVWSVRNAFNRSGSGLEVRATTVDAQGNLYFTGILKGSPEQKEAFNIWTGKISPKGDLLWAKDFDAGSEDIGNAIAVDGFGNVHVAGHSHRGGNFRDYVHLKYSSTGLSLWTLLHGSRLEDEAKALALDAEGNIYLTGSTDTVKFNSEGKQLWAQSGISALRLGLGPKQEVYVFGLAQTDQARQGGELLSKGKPVLAKYDGAGQVITNWLLPEFLGEPGFAIDASGHTYLSAAGTGTNAATATSRYDPSGQLLWTARLGQLPANATESTAALMTDSSGNVFVTATTLASNRTHLDLITAKYDASGKAIWSVDYSSAGSLTDQPRAIAVGPGGEIYVAGSTLDPAARIASLFLIRYEEIFPSLLRHPVRTNVVSGSSASFAVTAEGTPPLFYQWRLNGQLLPGSTNAQLLIPMATMRDAGAYDVVVSNRLGSATSDTALLEISFRLEAKAGRGGAVVREPFQTSYSSNAVVQLTAQPNAGFVFSHWSGAVESLENPIEVTVDQDRTVQANFSATGETFVRVERIVQSSFDFTNRASVTVELETSFPKGTIFYTLDGSEPALSSPVYQNPILLTNSTLIRAIAFSTNFTTAITAPVPVNLWKTFELKTSTLGGGAFLLDPPGGVYRNDKRIRVVAQPAPGGSFVQWEGDASGTNSETHVLMDRARIIGAVFGTAPLPEINGSGRIRFIPSRSIYPYGSSVQALALPEADHFFALWGGHAHGTTNPFPFTITNAAPKISALFAALKQDEVALTVLPNGRGKIIISPPQSVFRRGDLVAIRAVADPKESFYFWSGGASGGTNELKFTIVSTKVITANFSGGEYEPRASAASWDKSGRFRFSLTGEPGRNLRVEHSGDFQSWSLLKVVSLSQEGIALFEHFLGTNAPPHGFFRTLPE